METSHLPFLLRYLVRFFHETTVHGFKYVVTGLTLFERVLWMLVIAASIGFAGTLVHQSLQGRIACLLDHFESIFEVGPRYSILPLGQFIDLKLIRYTGNLTMS